ncbi:MAG: polysaccharide export protein EpsE [Thiogranum sp.]|nr:polysaccharide export protein EpsE [Thiogranum sp.]
MDSELLKSIKLNRVLSQWTGLFLLLVMVGYSPAYAAEEYKLGGGDTVTIMVYEQPDLSVEARISEDDGTIGYPLLGRVALRGLTPESAGKKIATLLESRGFINNPQVTLAVKSFVSQKIPIMGQVNKPGEYALTGESRVVDLLSQAGGVKEDAADTIVVVKNNPEGRQVRHEIDLLQFYAGDMTQNIQVQEGDFILVPKMDTFYIHGEVKRPGSYRLERGMTVMQALSVGGGITDRGSTRGMKVTRRGADGSTEKVNVELTDELKANDVLFVKERLF